MQYKTIKSRGENKCIPRCDEDKSAWWEFSQSVAREMLTRVNKKVSDAACICIVHGSTKEKST